MSNATAIRLGGGKFRIRRGSAAAHSQAYFAVSIRNPILMGTSVVAGCFS